MRVLKLKQAIHKANYYYSVIVDPGSVNDPHCSSRGIFWRITYWGRRPHTAGIVSIVQIPRGTMYTACLRPHPTQVIWHTIGFELEYNWNTILYRFLVMLPSYLLIRRCWYFHGNGGVSSCAYGDSKWTRPAPTWWATQTHRLWQWTTAVLQFLKMSRRPNRSWSASGCCREACHRPSRFLKSREKKRKVINNAFWTIYNISIYSILT